MSDFVHLHVHSHYSLLDGACTTKGLLKMAQEYNMPAVAMTDHGFMGGTIDMYHTFDGSGVKPIFGCEVYVSPTTRFDRDAHNPDIRGFHLVLLAENNAGYHSLCKLLSEAWLNGMYYKPRVDKELLRQHHDGLIALSACIGGEIPQMILRNDRKRAEELIAEHRDIFGKENLFIEIMDHGMEEERKCNAELIKLARQFQLPIVGTNDVHYLKKEHAKAHEIMLCVQTNAKLDDPRHFRFSGPDYYFKSPDEMKEIFKEIPEAISNTLLVAERCDVSFKFVPDVNHYPVFKIPTGEPELEYLTNICLNGAKERYNIDFTDGHELTEWEKTVKERMDYELGIINRTKYCSYFLVVSDFIRHAKEQDIPVGPGRGSGAGSLVAYLTKITDIDPLRYNLLFERFLNPERVSPPDFDVDFCEDRRTEVIDYVRQKYGADSVAQICTYGQMKAKAVIKDVARVLGYDFAHGDRITKLIPSDPKMTLAKAIEESKDLKALIDSEDWVREIFEYATVIEGLNRQLGIHAAGVIIGDQRLDNVVPLTRGAQNEVITEFPALHCEELGLLKMDFLGLRTLTTIKRAVGLIKQTHGIQLDMATVPLDDENTFDLLRRGDTIAVFQLESGGMQNLCRQFGVDTLEHIIALLAIYRPGPMQFIPEFVRRKRGYEEVIYDHPKMEQYLQETYGIMLYQEQIMQVVQALAGFSLGGADILRRAIGKKKKDVLAKQQAKFIEGCAEANNIPASVAEEIWKKIEMFAGYGFNKSHSAAYAFVSYQTAYLKANYPVEFMAAVLTAELANADQIAFLINACKEMNIQVLPPNVNSSLIQFGVANGAIRFGLGAIKGVGEVAAKKIIESREADGLFKDFTDFCERCGDAMNSRMIEHLTRAGAFDGLGLRRSQILATAEATMAYAQAQAKDRKSGQGSLFDFLDDSEKQEICTVPIPDIPEFDQTEILKSEKELLGFYVTGHPLSPYAELIEAFSSIKLRDKAQLSDNEGVRVAGLIKTLQKKFSKNTGKPYMILELEDLDTTIECMIYERGMQAMGELVDTLAAEQTVLVSALVNRRDEEETPKLIVEKILPLEDAPGRHSEELIVYCYEKDQTKLRDLQQMLSAHPGETRLVLSVVVGEGAKERVVFIETTFLVELSMELLKSLHRLLGDKCFKIKADKEIPAPRQRYNWKEKNAESGEEKQS